MTDGPRISTRYAEPSTESQMERSRLTWAEALSLIALALVGLLWLIRQRR